MKRQRKYVYVTVEGGLWRLTLKQWRRYCEASTTGRFVSIGDYGPELTSPLPVQSPLNWTTEEFEDALTRLKEI